MPKPYFFDPQQKVQEIIMVNHAGEYGAQRIYQGQLAWTRDSNAKIVIQDMLEQELEHLQFFHLELVNTKTRPTFLLPMWDMVGYGIGAISAMIGTRTSMLLTDAIEEVIVDHYQEQIDYFNKCDPSHPLLPKIKQFQQEEEQHMQIAIDHSSRKLPLFNLASRGIKTMCQFAINLSKKI
ncbi:MAG: demethoxyubiquinone hydroxylase family protein [Rickettsiaceae bacterium]